MCALLIILAGLTPARSDTISVIGVVVDESGVRRRGIPVGLYITAKGKPHYAAYTTGLTGVYYLFATNLFDLDTIYVLSEDPAHYAEPLKLDLGQSFSGPGGKIIPAGDLVLLPPRNVYDAKTASRHIAALANTEAMKVRFRKTTPAKANEIVASQAARIAAATQTADKKKVPLGTILKGIEPLLDTSLPHHAILDKDAFLKLKDHRDYRPLPFRPHDSANLNPAKWRLNPGVLTPDVLKLLTADGGRAIDPKWVDDSKSLDLLRSVLRKQAGQRERYTTGFLLPRGSGITPVLETDLSDEGIRRLLKEIPSARAWVLSQKMRADPKMPKAQLQFLREQTSGLRPIVIEKK
jgi:hypothetical protein